MASTKIEIIPNGPYMVEGDFELIGTDEKPIELKKPRIFLCRCGASSNKPFCDGTHKDIPFLCDNIMPEAE